MKAYTVQAAAEACTQLLRQNQNDQLATFTDGMGLAHVVQSYVDEATIAFTADRDMMPDADFYARCVERSFTTLRDAAGQGIPLGPAQQESRQGKGVP